jgi:hypothetical protein
MINNIAKITLAILIIIFLFWNRIIRKRLPIEISELPINHVIMLAIIILLLIRIIICIIKLKQKSAINEQNTFLNYILKMYPIIKLQEYLHSPKYLYERISNKFSFRPIIEKPFSYLAVYCFYPKMLKTIFVFVPKIIFALLFFIDVICYEKFNLIYYFMFLPVIPIIFHSYLYIAEDFSKKYINYLAHHIVFKKINKGFEVTPVEFVPNIPDALTILELNDKFDVIVDHWEIYTTISNYIQSLNNSFNKSEHSITLFILTLYLISWTYIYFNIT